MTNPSTPEPFCSQRFRFCSWPQTRIWPAAKTQAPAAAAPAHANCQPSAFRVVVDVGHTLDVPGALSARGVPEYAFNLQLARQIKETLVGAGFDKTVLLITAKAPPVGLFERAMVANRLPADLFISIHHDSVPDNLMQTWQYEGQDQHYNDDYPGYALFISNDNADRAGSLQFGKFLGKALQARGLQFTPHYTLAADGQSPPPAARCRCRRLPLRPIGRAAPYPHAGAAARSRLDRQPAGRTGIGDAGAPHAYQ